MSMPVPSCRMCPEPAVRWVSWWNPAHDALRDGQRGLVCWGHMHEVWRALNYVTKVWFQIRSLNDPILAALEKRGEPTRG